MYDLGGGLQNRRIAGCRSQNSVWQEADRLVIPCYEKIRLMNQRVVGNSRANLKEAIERDLNHSIDAREFQ